MMENYIKLYNKNCLDVLKGMPDNSIDLIVTDPPYKVTSRGCSGTMGGYWKEEKAKKGDIFDNNNIKAADFAQLFFDKSVSNAHCYIMVNNLNLQEYLNEFTKAGWKFIKSIIWDKGNKICGRYYMNAYEHILMFRKGNDKPINNCGTSDILSVPIKKHKDQQGKNLHDTEKPVELMAILIQNSTNEGDIVCDPFMGIGASGVAAQKTNRKFVGVEIDTKYFNIAKERIEHVTTSTFCNQQGGLF